MPGPTFPLSDLVEIDHPANLVDDNPVVPDVPRAFSRIATDGDLLAAQDGGIFPPYAYTHVQAGDNEAKNHFQGLQRLRSGQYMIVSGAFATGVNKNSHVFVVRMGTRPARGPWGSNLIAVAEPRDQDTVVGVYGVQKTRWHPGGVSRLGDIVVVPLMEGGGDAKMVFLHTEDPQSLGQFKVGFITPGQKKAGAAGLTKLEDGRFVCAVWREVKAKCHGRIDFYISVDTDFCNGFLPTSAQRWVFTGFGGQNTRDPAYQHISFVTQQKGNTRQLYLIGTENGSRLAPTKNGPNWADLWEVQLSSDMFSSDPGRPQPVLVHRHQVEYHAKRDYFNLAAGGGVYIDDRGALHLYGCYHWRVSRGLRFAEFPAHPGGTITDIADAWIELFEHDKYRGKKLGIYGTPDSTIPDYGAIFVAAEDFNETVSSAQYQIPAGHTYRLYRDPFFTPAAVQGRDYVDLVGDGKVRKIADLKRKPHKFGDTVSSSRYL